MLYQLLIWSITVVNVCSGWSWKCSFCWWASDAIINYNRMGESEQFALGVVSDACEVLRIYPRPVCQGMVTNVGSRLFSILRLANGTISSGDICGLVLGPSCSQGSSDPDWSLDIPDLDNVPAYNPPQVPDYIANVTKILHLSDVHVQMNYSIGSPTKCDYPLCCLSFLNRTDSADGGAKYWGDYACDLPPWSLDSTLANIKTNHPDIDMILLTGDFPAHDVWLQSQNYNLETIQIVSSSLRKYFPNTPVLPSVGNHESYPVNMFPGWYPVF